MENYFKSSISYYFKWLVDNGYNDPMKVIISDFLNTVKITDEQREYIASQTKIEKNNIDNILILLKKMKVEKKIDVEAINLIEKELKKLL